MPSSCDATSSEKVSVCAGTSGSVAVAVNVSVDAASASWSLSAPKVGARLTSATVIVNVSLAVSQWGSAPLSVTVTVTL